MTHDPPGPRWVTATRLRLALAIAGLLALPSAGGTPRRWQNATARIARTGRLEGRVVDGGSVVPAFTAVAFAVDHARRFEDSPWVRSAAPDQRGVFRLDLPPGDYWVVAIDRPAAITAALLDSLTSAAERVRVEQTPTVQRDLRLVRLP